MSKETLLGIAPEDGQKPEMHSDTVAHFNHEGEHVGEGEVFYYYAQGVIYVTKLEGCDAEDLHLHFRTEWHFDN